MKHVLRFAVVIVLGFANWNLVLAEDNHAHEKESEKSVKSDQSAATPHDDDVHENEHAHGGQKKKVSAEAKDEHGHGDENGHGDEHGHDKGEAEDKHEEEGSTSVGEGKAVSAAAENGTKLKLSAAAEKNLGIKTASFALTKGVIEIPKSAIVEYQANAAVFRKTLDGWYQFISVKILVRNAKTLSISSESFQSSETLVVSGVPLLRAGQLEASGQGGEGHAH